MSVSRKNRRVRHSTRRVYGVVALGMLALVFGFFLNTWGQFTDIRGFYGMRYIYGDHPWPFSEYIRPDGSGVVAPVEYPALTGLILWTLTFLIPSGGDVTLKYYYLTVFINGIAFLSCILILDKLAKRNYVFLLILAPAVITALNRNWDIWAVLALLASISFFQKQEWNRSAVLLGVGIATKFFPIVLLLPITVFFIREKRYKSAIRYLLISSLTWLVINVPIMLVNPKGWAYFYELSFSRGLSDGSIFSILDNIGISIFSQSTFYYIFNGIIFSALLLFLLMNRNNISLMQSAFLAMFAFTFFGKQYSMQYVLWIAPLAVAGISMIRGSQRTRLVLGYIGWQITEILFHHAYYQNLLARVLESRGSPLEDFWSNTEYSVVALIRYTFLFIFVVLYVSSLMSEQPNRPHHFTSGAQKNLPKKIPPKGR